MSLIPLVDPAGSVEAVMKFISQRPEGASADEMEVAGFSKDVMLKSLNRLLSEVRIEAVMTGNNRQVFRALSEKARGLDPESRRVYDAISNAGDKGIWSRVLSQQCGMQPHATTKVLKELIRRQLIKEVKSIQNKHRKLYMLYEIEPSREVTGGSWYQDGEFNMGWFETLRKRCQEYMERSAGKGVGVEEILHYVRQQPGPQVPSSEDVASIMRTLQLDEEVMAVSTEDGRKCFTKKRRRDGGHDWDAFIDRFPSWNRDEEPRQLPVSMAPPCIRCPLVQQCCPGGVICPEKCEYLSRWMDGDDKKGNETDMDQDAPIEW
eukprot:TRINITY_DN26559_c0_g1_i1.p1 TRINITY_DN26559_c0_g1~~TRINITY_DN26559_c0_g1_i1.p1  ORF type:complete len:320 (-),score=77.20 TRINITY_DN26559_c0_g1_i1:13-972(-)